MNDDVSTSAAREAYAAEARARLEKLDPKLREEIRYGRLKVQERVNIELTLRR